MRYKDFHIDELFILVPGQYHATKELDPGPVPLVSCGWENNGVIGYYDIEEQYTHRRMLTVAFNGVPLTTHFHPYKFGAKDDVAVLRPIDVIPDSVLIYIAAQLNAETWRYSYGRKCYREKLKHVSLTLPVMDEKDVLDPSLPDALLRDAHAQVKAAALASVTALLDA